jgi:hypothetical protein
MSWFRTCLSNSPVGGRERLDQLLLSRGQDTPQPDHEKIPDQVRVDVFGAPPHVFLFESTDPFGDGSFDFSLCFHLTSNAAALAMATQGFMIPKRGETIELLPLLKGVQYTCRMTR